MYEYQTVRRVLPQHPLDIPRHVGHTEKLYPGTYKVENCYVHKLEGDYSANYYSNIVKAKNHYCGWQCIPAPVIKAPRNIRNRITYLAEREAGGLLHTSDRLDLHMKGILVISC